MKLVDILIEARKNPDRNPKTSINHIIADALPNPPKEAFEMALASGELNANLVKQYAANKGIQL